MTGPEFRAGLESLYGPRYRPAASAAFDVHVITIDRWANGRIPVPGPAGKLLEHLLAQQRLREKLRVHDRAYKQRKANARALG